jgi:hypothetical protein
MTKTNICLGITLVGMLLLTGCSNTLKDSGNSDKSSDASGTGDGWQCNSQEDGLGEEYSCTSQVTDEFGTIWTLTLLCTSDQRALHSIYGLDSSFSDIIWDENQFDTAQVRIDSNEIEEWDFFVKAEGRALVFANSAGDRMDEASSTWEFLTKISSAKTLGFQAYDAAGSSHSAKFTVQDSVPIAATFSAMGCSS